MAFSLSGAIGESPAKLIKISLVSAWAIDFVWSHLAMYELYTNAIGSFGVTLGVVLLLILLYALRRYSEKTRLIKRYQDGQITAPEESASLEELKHIRKSYNELLEQNAVLQKKYYDMRSAKDMPLEVSERIDTDEVEIPKNKTGIGYTANAKDYILLPVVDEEGTIVEFKKIKR